MVWVEISVSTTECFPLALRHCLLKKREIGNRLRGLAVPGCSRWGTCWIRPGHSRSCATQPDRTNCLQTTTNSQSPFRIAHNWAKLYSVMGSGSSYTCQALSSRMPSTANDRSLTVTASRVVLRTNQDPCRLWISSTWPSIYSLSIIHNVKQKTSSKANGKLILLRYATHRGKRSSTCVAMVRSSIHMACPTTSLSLVPPWQPSPAHSLEKLTS